MLLPTAEAVIEEPEAGEMPAVETVTPAKKRGKAE